MSYIYRFIYLSLVVLTPIFGSADALFVIKTPVDASSGQIDRIDDFLNPPLAPTEINIVPEASAGFPQGIAVESGKLCWTDGNNGEVKCSNIDGSNQITVASNQIDLRGIDIDPIAQRVYWIDNGSGNGVKINNAPISGGTVTEVTLFGIQSLIDLAVDPAGGKVYFTDSISVRRMSLSGANLETLFTPPVIPFGVGTINPFPYAIAVAPEIGKVYWTDFVLGAVSRGNLDGSGSIEPIASNQSSPQGIDIDHANGLLYWVDTGLSDIKSTNLDGSNLTTVNAGSNWTDIAYGITTDGKELIPGTVLTDAPVIISVNQGDRTVEFNLEAFDPPSSALLNHTAALVSEKSVIYEVSFQRQDGLLQQFLTQDTKNKVKIKKPGQYLLSYKAAVGTPIVGAQKKKKKNKITSKFTLAKLQVKSAVGAAKKTSKRNKVTKLKTKKKLAGFKITNQTNQSPSVSFDIN